MKFQFYLEKLLVSKEFDQFLSENSDAYLCSAFFSLDRQGKDAKQHLDFYTPSTKKLFSFQLETGLEPMPVEKLDKNVPSKLKDNIEIDFDDFEDKVLAKMKEKEMKQKIQKIILSLQDKDGKSFAFGTVFIDGLGLIKVTYDLDTEEFLDFEKKSFFDLMKIVKK